MKAWTHLVVCKEFEESHGADYDVKAVNVNGVWRLAERGFTVVRYGGTLTQVRIVKERKEDTC